MGVRLRLKITISIGVVVTIISSIFFVWTMLNAGGLFTGEIPRRENVSSKYSMLVGKQVPEFELVQDYLKKQEPNSNRILWHPLNFANYIFIQDSTESKSLYAGTSYLRETTRQRDYPGFYNLGPQHEMVMKSMMNGDLGPLCQAVWQNNINLVISNNFMQNEDFKNKVKNYFSHEADFDILEPQRSAQFRDTFFGAPVASFGKGFDIYQIHPNLKSQKIEVYEGYLWKDELKNRNWCVKSEIGKVESSYKYYSQSKEYHITTSIKNAHNLSLILADDRGYRYRLVIESPSADQIETVNYRQDGAKFIVDVLFNTSFTGKISVRLVSQSWFEKNMKLVLLVQALLLVSFLLSVIFIRLKMNHTKCKIPGEY